MPWRARFGDHVAEGDRSTVSCSDERVEGEARTLLAEGGISITPTGPFVRLPSEEATWCAFLRAINYTYPEIAELDVEGGPPTTELPFDPNVIY